MKRMQVLLITVPVVLLCLLASLFFFGCEDDWCFITNSQRVRATKSFGECLLRGFPVTEGYPRVCKLPNGNIFVETILPKEDTSNSSQKSEVPEKANIIVTEPKEGAFVSSPLIVRGEARVFENQFAYQLFDEDGSVLLDGSAMAMSPDIGQYGPFEMTLQFTPKGNTGTLEVFDYSAKDGEKQDIQTVHLVFH